MKIQSKFNQTNQNPDFITILKSALQKNSLEFNCMRIGIIQEFFKDDLTVDVLIANKKTLVLNTDGTQRVENYPLIRAKVCYCSPFISFPINKGDECVLLFSDREIESWFINGDINPLGYPRMHDITDAVALIGIRSMPNMIAILENCLNLFYGQSNIALENEQIVINSPTVKADNFQALNGASGNLIDSQGKTLAKVEYGIITEIY